MIQLTDEYKKVAKEYRKTFGYSVPLSMVPPTVEMPDLIEMISRCVKEKKDNLLEQLGTQTEEGRLY